jgi:hypothetical protein
MNRSSMMTLVACMLSCGCQQTRSIAVSRTATEEEQRFAEAPCCPTTHGLVMAQHGDAVPLILATLDRLSGETNAPTRCSIIQGALWNADNCTNTPFQAIIERGNKDPSESVRLKTTRMVESRLEILRTRQRVKKEAEQTPAGDRLKAPPEE